MAGKQNHRINWNADSMIENAKALQRVVKELEKNRPVPSLQDKLLFLGTGLAVPNLLSLAIEIALKAWQCRERQEVSERTHDLLKLFQSLEQNTQEMLEARMRKRSPDSVQAEEPRRQNLSPDVQDMLGARIHPLRDVLRSHSDVNIRWRYIHEETSAQFETPAIDRALTVIIDAYEKKWRNLP